MSNKLERLNPTCAKLVAQWNCTHPCITHSKRAHFYTVQYPMQYQNNITYQEISNRYF